MKSDNLKTTLGNCVTLFYPVLVLLSMRRDEKKYTFNIFLTYSVSYFLYRLFFISLFLQCVHFRMENCNIFRLMGMLILKTIIFSYLFVTRAVLYFLGFSLFLSNLVILVCIALFFICQ